MAAESHSFRTAATAKQPTLRPLTLAELKTKIYRNNRVLTLVLSITS